MTTEEIHDLFRPAPGTIYLDAATYGLPPRPTVRAMEEALGAWQAGTARWREDWDQEGEVCRALFAELLGADAADVALIPTVSVGVATVAAALRPGDVVVVPEDEFTSVVFPFLVVAERRGVVVRQVPYAALPKAIAPGTALIAFSLVQSQAGRTAPLAEICRVAEVGGARVLVDATHAIPFVPVADQLRKIAFLVCHGYKHLLCPRGVAFLYVSRSRWAALPPIHANWRAAAPLYGRSYGGPLSLAPSAARFDVSLDWLEWVGARRSLELLLQWQRAGQLQGTLDLATELAARLGLDPPTSSIVGVPVDDASRALAVLAAAGIRAAAPAGLVRLSPHVYNTAADVRHAVDVLAPLLARRR